MSGKTLVVVESPAKAKTINKILGPEYTVKASMGHVRDLPEGRLGVDIEHGFEPEYVTLKDRARTVKELKEAAKECGRIILAPDPDREGEAIAWHLKAVLRGAVTDDKFERVTYNEITAPAIRRAFSNPGRIDMRKVDSQQARRILDRLVGYRVSPFVWRRIRGGSSAGRVQSVALRLVCEREQAIRDFRPEEYWLVGATVAKRVDPRDPFSVRLAKIDGENPKIGGEKEALVVRADLEGRPLRVAAIVRRELSRNPPPPFITSTMQQAASAAIGYSPDRTMKLAQALYEGVDFGTGLITYMRTDSPNVAKEAQEACRAFIGGTLGAEYLPEKPPFYKSRSSAQEAHEAIRPTDVTRTPESLEGQLKPDEWKLYRLVWQRFVASQMAPARIARRTAEIEAVPPSADARRYLFRATTSEITFPGFMKVLGAGIEKSRKPEEGQAEGEDVDRLPPLDEGEELDRLEWLLDQKFTQPPPRFNEATLVRALEENGIGRPSTYAQILSTLVNRRYVLKEKRNLRPTDVGEKVNGFLVGHLDHLFDVTFTAGMEESLDRIEEGEVEWTAMLGDFNGKLNGWLDAMRSPAADAAEASELLGLSESIREWAPEEKRGKRTYGDERFVKSLRTQLREKNKALSELQANALRKMLVRYRAQIPTFDAVADRLGLTAVAEAGTGRGGGGEPRADVSPRLQLLEGLEFDPPRQVGKRVFDDREFFQSLRRQHEQGRSLSDNQVRYLDRLIFKYKARIPDFETRSAQAGVSSEEAAAPASTVKPEDIRTCLDQLAAVTDWKPPVKKGKREWDDKAFYESLKRQFDNKGSLSPKQFKSMQRMATRYTRRAKDE